MYNLEKLNDEKGKDKFAEEMINQLGKEKEYDVKNDVETRRQKIKEGNKEAVEKTIGVKSRRIGNI